jgi:hypothetical protein
MVIKSAQIEAFSRSVLEEFENRMVRHLTKCFPEKFGRWGEAKVRQVIRLVVSRPSAHQITAQRDVCKFIDLMIVFGPRFDEDPALGWPQSVLSDRSLREPTVKMERLYEYGKSKQPLGQPHGT